MLLGLLSLIALASVPLAGGRLSRLADLPVRATGVLVAGLAMQVVVIEIVPDPRFAPVVHVFSYVVVGVFVWANRTLPGMRLIGIGGALNFIAIAANGGTMPAGAEVLATAGLTATPGAFENSAFLEHARLAVLGDIFAVPASWPLANVFSIGDVLLLAGFATGVHRICESRLVPVATRSLGSLATNRDFKRLWIAQALSNGGDWIYTLAVFTVAASQDGAPQLLAALLIAQMGPSALIGALGGSLVDRLPRGLIMVSSDVLRALAVASLFLVDEPSVAHFMVVAAALGACGALFAPSVHASLPGLVGEQDLVRANAILSTTYNAAVMVAPAAGGFIVAQQGPEAAFAVNALSFGISAVLIARCRLGRSPSPAAAADHGSLRASVRAARRHALSRSFALVGAVVMVAAAVKTPTEPTFVLSELAARPEALGLVTATWGIGMVAGSSIAHYLSRMVTADRLFVLSVTVVAAAVLLGAAVPGVPLLLPLWLVAGVGNGIGVVVFDALLQRRSPEHLRGRIAATTEAAMDVGYLAGAAAAAGLASVMGPRGCLAMSGVLFLASAVAWRTVAEQAPTGQGSTASARVSSSPA